MKNPFRILIFRFKSPSWRFAVLGCLPGKTVWEEWVYLHLAVGYYRVYLEIPFTRKLREKLGKPVHPGLYHERKKP